MSRTADRQSFDPGQRITLAEHDLDSIEAGMSGLRDEMRAQGDRQNKTLNRVLWAVLTLLSTLVGALLLALVQAGHH